MFFRIHNLDRQIVEMAELIFSTQIIYPDVLGFGPLGAMDQEGKVTFLNLFVQRDKWNDIFFSKHT